MTINYPELQQELIREVIPQSLYENYESIYAVDIETSAWQCFYGSDSFSSLRIENRGDDFFGSLTNNIFKTIYPDDQELVQQKLSKKTLLKGVEKEKYYSFVYRLIIDGQPLYHKLRATKGLVKERPYILSAKG